MLITWKSICQVSSLQNYNFLFIINKNLRGFVLFKYPITQEPFNSLIYLHLNGLRFYISSNGLWYIIRIINCDGQILFQDRLSIWPVITFVEHFLALLHNNIVLTHLFFFPASVWKKDPWFLLLESFTKIMQYFSLSFYSFLEGRIKSDCSQ